MLKQGELRLLLGISRRGVYLTEIGGCYVVFRVDKDLHSRVAEGDGRLGHHVFTVLFTDDVGFIDDESGRRTGDENLVADLKLGDRLAGYGALVIGVVDEVGVAVIHLDRR